MGELAVAGCIAVAVKILVCKIDFQSGSSGLDSLIHI